MALGKTISNPQLLDTLCALSDLVKALSDGDVKKAVDDIKSQKSALDLSAKAHAQSRASNEKIIDDLNEKIEENKKISQDIDKKKAELEKAAHDHANNIRKYESDKKALETSKKEHADHVAQTTSSLEARLKSLTARQAIADSLHQQATAIQSEYEAKMAHLKKIAG